jgi:hypothetical protein
MSPTVQQPGDVLLEVRALFERQKTGDVVAIFLKQRFRGGTPAVSFGSTVNSPVVVLPLNARRMFSGTELEAAILDFYNREYWLLALWYKLCENSKDSMIGREITRAFIKNCILTTAEELIIKSPVVNALFIKENGLINLVNFYKKAFDWSRIYNNIRMKPRRIIEQRFRVQRKAGRGIKIKHRLDEPVQEGLLREINNLLADSDFPVIVATAKAPESPMIGDIVRFIYLEALFWRDKRRIRCGLKKLLLDVPGGGQK